MPVAVVMGMHRSGTSAVAGMLAAMGVDMGAVLLGDSATQPVGHWEDVDFVNLNTDILADSGGVWNDPQPVDWRTPRPEVALLVTLKQRPELHGEEPREPGAWWGWKDPRTCLTAACYHQYLAAPHYIAVDRRRSDIIASLEWRNGKAGDLWGQLIDAYLEQREWFLSQVQAPVLRMQYEHVVADPKVAALKLAAFLEMDGHAAARAADAIKPRDPNARPTRFAVHLGDASKRDYRSTTQVLNAPGDNAQDALLSCGPVHELVVGEDVTDDTARAWLARVRPGGTVRLERNLAHDWPGTAWDRISDGIYTRKPFLRAGDPFGTVGIGVPYFKAEYEFFRWWTWLMTTGTEPGDLFLNDATVTAPLPIPMVHNRLMARFLESDRDTLVIVEDDHVGDSQVLRQMREKRENWDFDIVTANYVNRRADPGIAGYKLATKPNRNGEYLCILDYQSVWKTGTQPVDGSVMGLVLIRRWVLDAMLNFGNPRTTFWCEWKGANSQDINFYGKARDVGARVGVDRDANIGHVAQRIATVDDFWKAREGRR